MKSLFQLLLTSFYVINFSVVNGQSDSVSFFSASKKFNKSRFNTIIVSEAALLTGSTIALNQLWYKEYKTESFHFFNDWKEWKQVDKAGHAFTTYQIGRVGISLMKWSGVEDKKAAWIGGSLGSIYMTSIEVLDGFSSGWGFSATDIAANTVGSAIVISQHLIWGEQRINIKYSFRRSRYYELRPELLGSSFSENLIKDYNGQTYWLSVTPKYFFNAWPVPKWLAVSFGYGADGMVYARAEENNKTFFKQHRQYYLSLDIDLSEVKTKFAFLNTVLHTINFIKFPFPSIEYSSLRGFNGHYIGF